MAHLLAIRFSALGDVAMTIAALKAFADKYPDDQITLLSRPVAGALTEGLPSNVHLRPVNLDDYKGLAGLHKLSRELLSEDYDVLVDWHDVLRSKVIRFFFRRAKRKVAVIDKGRKERKLLTRPANKRLVQLTTSPERYAATLGKAGFPIELKPYCLFGQSPADISDLSDIASSKGQDIWIGIAPFAAHQGKVYPLHLMDSVISELADQEHPGWKGRTVRIFLFGSGSEERAWCEQAEKAHRNVTSLIGKSNLRKELRLISNMDVMLTMDSANMHLSALAGTKTVSIWGATHPLAGFSGMQVEGSRQVQLPLECRPCSIFGNKKCQYGDYRCLSNIKPETVAATIIKTINS